MSSDEWPAWCTNVVIATARYPGRGGVESVVSNLVPMFRSVGAEVQVISVFPGVGKPRARTTTLFGRRPHLQERSITGSRRIDLNSLRALPLLVMKRFDILTGRRRLRRLFTSLPHGTLIVATGPNVAHHLPMSTIAQQPHRFMLAVQFHIPFATQLNVEGKDLSRSRSLRPDAFVAVNRSDAELFSDALGVECIAIPNPIASLAAVPAEPARDRDARTARSTVVSLSRLSGEKQLDRMMQNFLRATESEHLRHWRLDVYGEGDERRHLEEWIAQTPGATDRVRLMGWTDQREAVLAGAALLLSTSRFESFGMNVLEAAQHGTPTLAFACSPGITDLTRDLGGVLVDADDDDAFVDRLRQLLSAPEELDRMGRESRTRCEPYTATSVVGQWGRLVRRIGAAHDGRKATR